MFWRHHQKLTYVLCALVAAAIAVSVGTLTSADERLLDLLVKAREIAFSVDGTAELSPVVVIAMDKRSLDEPEIAPYPRTFLAPVWATVLDAVFDAGAQAVGFDLLFSYSANRFSPDFDTPFLSVLGKHRERVVLARSAATLPAPPFLAALRNNDEALGLIDLTADSDGSYRRVYREYATEGNGALTGFAAALLRQAKGPSMPPEIVLAPRRHLERIPTYALIDVLRCASRAPESLQKAFAGRVVLIGGSLAEEDRRLSSGRLLSSQRTDSAPLHACGLKRLGASVLDSQTVPGVFIHAAAVEAVMTGMVTSTTPPLIVALLTAATATAGVILGMILLPWLVLAAIGAIAVVLFGVATALLSANIWIPLALPLGALVVTPAVAYVVRYMVEEKTRRQIEHAFSHYLSPMIVNKLVNDVSALKLGGEVREVTVMFADLSGFTKLSGRVTPEVLTHATNQYLSYIVEQVEASGGYVDKFIGDAVMAMWGAPVEDHRHAVNGIRAALCAVSQISKEQEAAKARGDISFSVKIGLNSGRAIVGNVGTDKRYNYTAVGEMVNLAARLEGVPSIYGCQIVVGQMTAEIAKKEYLLRELDTIRVKGRETPLSIFEPIVENAKASKEQIDRGRRYADALAHYRSMHFVEACSMWEALSHEEQEFVILQDGKREVLLGPSARLAERARSFGEQPPLSPWDGVWVLTEK